MNGRHRFLMLALAGIATGGCATARLAVPTELADAPRYAVVGRQGVQGQREVRFGPYRLQRVERSWVRGAGLALSDGRRDLRLDRATQEYAFAFGDGPTPDHEVRCVAAFRHAGLELPEGTLSPVDRSSLRCAIVDGLGIEWTLDLRESFDRPPKGTLHWNDRRITVAGTSRLDGGLATQGLLAGYHLWDGGVTVGAVEMVNDGAVWLNSRVEGAHRHLLAAAAAALLLHHDLRSAMEGANAASVATRR